MSEMIWSYALAVMNWADGLTKTEMLTMFGVFLLGHYVGSKQNARSKKVGV